MSVSGAGVGRGEMKLKDILKLLSSWGLSLDPKMVVLALAAAGALIALAVKGYKWWKQRPGKAAATPSLFVSPGSLANPLTARRLRASWGKFLGRLPRTHRRSILNFEHFLLVGPSSAGKSRLIDTQTDWAYQMRQVARPGSVEADFPAVLASGAIITELPSSLLEDQSQGTRDALDGVWRRLYRQRGPTIVAVFDAMHCARCTRDELTRVVRAVRVRINQVSAIRRVPVEVRIALTHLDQLPGFDVTARFWANQGISSRIALAPEGPLGDSVREWSAEAKAQLPRALSVSSSDEFRQVLAFLRTLEQWLVPLERALDVMFAREPTSLDPIRGGVFLCSEVPKTANPLRDAHERGRGPDPTRRHLIAVTAGSSALITFFLMAFATQRAEWKPAAHAMSAYQVSPDIVDTPSEMTMRKAVTAFTAGSSGFVSRFPPFFSGTRERMALRFSELLRNELLVPHLRKIAIQGGLLDPHGNTLRWRRSVYLLSLLHSDRDDRLKILERRHIEVFAEMTGLSMGLIQDYLANSPHAYVEPVIFDLQDETNPYDKAATWAELPDRIDAALSDGLIREDELAGLQQLVQRLRAPLARFERDELTMQLLAGVGHAAASESTPSGRALQLQNFYDQKFREVAGICVENRMHQLYEVLSGVFELVSSSSIGVAVAKDGEAPLTSLVSGLRVLQKRGADKHTSSPLVHLDLAGRRSTIDPNRWNDVLAISQAQALVEQFLAANASSASPFFAPRDDGGVPDIEWNAVGTAASLFQGRGTLRGRYTAVGFERNVKGPLQDISELLGQFSIEPTTEQALRRALVGAVGRYAQEYTAEAERFLSVFRVHAPSPEALRVVLGQVSGEGSSFDEFVSTLDVNTALDMKPSPERTKLNQAVADGGPSGTSPGTASAAATAPACASGDVPASSGNTAGTATAGATPGAAPCVDATVTAVAATPSTQIRATLQLDDLLSPMQGVLTEFEAWHRAVGVAKGGTELTKYKEIAKQLLTDLSNMSDAAEADSPTPSLESGLSPAGKTSLASMRATTGAYRELAEQWAIGAGLPARQRRPFLAPFQQLARLGSAEVDDVVTRVWRADMLPVVREITTRFPFNPKATDAVTPEELEAAFHPTRGTFFQLFRNYLEPVSAFGDGQPFRALPSSRGTLRLPSDLYPMVNAVAALAARLWDEEGKPKPLHLKVAPVPFAANPKEPIVPTVVQLNVGSASVFNFNQKPTMSDLTVVWAGDEPAQLAIQTVNVDTRETFHPAALSAEGPNWRFFRLLAAGKLVRNAGKNGECVYEWRRPARDGERPNLRVRLRFDRDPWQLVSLSSNTSKRRSGQ